ncbi:hypothetical protein K469DRAFT_760354, partial [Zopfia rhizophila CBS 207.26]
VSRITTLHRGLRHSLRQHLEESSDSLFSLPYNEYVELVQHIDHHAWRPYPAQKPAPEPARHPTSYNTEPMELNHFSHIRSISPAPSQSSSSAERRSYRL